MVTILTLKAYTWKRLVKSYRCFALYTAIKSVTYPWQNIRVRIRIRGTVQFPIRNLSVSLNFHGYPQNIYPRTCIRASLYHSTEDHCVNLFTQ
jgi:hypothetical protein